MRVLYGRSYIASGLKSKGLLDIGPDITVACKVVTQLRHGLPCEDDCAIGRTVQHGPVHGLRLAHPGRTGEILHRRLGGHHMDVGIAIARDEVEVGELP